MSAYAQPVPSTLQRNSASLSLAPSSKVTTSSLPLTVSMTAEGDGDVDVGAAGAIDVAAEQRRPMRAAVVIRDNEQLVVDGVDNRRRRVGALGTLAGGDVGPRRLHDRHRRRRRVLAGAVRRI